MPSSCPLSASDTALRYPCPDFRLCRQPVDFRRHPDAVHKWTFRLHQDIFPITIFGLGGSSPSVDRLRRWIAIIGRHDDLFGCPQKYWPALVSDTMLLVQLPVFTGAAPRRGVQVGTLHKGVSVPCTVATSVCARSAEFGRMAILLALIAPRRTNVVRNGDSRPAGMCPPRHFFH